jgi:hypothetical protein
MIDTIARPNYTKIREEALSHTPPDREAIRKYSGIPAGWDSLIPEIQALWGDDLMQAKEKFGQLRISPSLDACPVTTELQNRARFMCMECGSHAEYFQQTGWVGPICKRCIING